MSDAILQCTEAAGAEFEPSLQKSLLRVRQLVMILVLFVIVMLMLTLVSTDTLTRCIW